MSHRNLILVEPKDRNQFKPLNWARPVAAFRLGILTIAEKWALHFHAVTSHAAPDYLAGRFPAQVEEDNYLVPGNALPSDELCSVLSKLATGEFLVCEGQWLGAHLRRDQCLEFLETGDFRPFQQQEGGRQLFRALGRNWEIFQWNESELERDFEYITRGRQSVELPSGNQWHGKRIFIEEGARVLSSSINSTTGPIYLGRGTEIMEGSLIRGPFALCEGAQVKMGAKIYGATTIGPGCRVGGECNNVVMQANSNKAHDGFLGNSAIGEWVNIGADSNASNLKNNYEEVRVWNYSTGNFEPTGSLFCGLIMGDHAKCGINSMFNTGTVVGYGANVFGTGFPRPFIPDFAWGGATGFSTFDLPKFHRTATSVLQRRQASWEGADQEIARYIFEQTRNYRNWESQ